MSRLEQLQKLAAAQPGEPLTHYALGLEYLGRERWADALAAFERVLALDPGYVAAYQQKARAELKAGRPDAARATLDAGIARARSAGDAHAADKMRELLETLA